MTDKRFKSMPYIRKLARMIRKVRKEHPSWDVFKFVEEAQKRLRKNERKKNEWRYK